MVNLKDLEFLFIYVGCADDASHDQVLEALTVSPIPMGFLIR